MQAAPLDGTALSWPWTIPFRAGADLRAPITSASLRSCLRRRHLGDRQSARHAAFECRNNGRRLSASKHCRHDGGCHDRDSAADSRQRSPRHNAHVPVPAIFLIANIGGTVTPLGNPPLFVGFLRGVDFFWPLQHLVPVTCLIAGLVLAIFIVVDAWYYRDEHPHVVSHHRMQSTEVRIRGWLNVPLIAAIMATIVLSSMWRPAIDIGFAGLRLENVLRDMVLTGIAIVSLRLTSQEHRHANGFSWEPIREVAKLFAGIFICIVPVLAMLQAGSRCSLAWLLGLTTDGDAPRNLAYFWLSGALSAFLDNAPTYLMFFDLAGGNANTPMGPLAGTLAAISIGASSMGALTYVGNAPNLMIQAIATERGIAMPSFFGFMVWSAVVLLPVFALAGYIFFG